jgi:hypothetical protein
MKITVIKQDIKRFKNQTVATIFTCIKLENKKTGKKKTAFPKCFKATANCSPEEEYNFNIGRRIALARAEIKAYNYYIKLLIDLNDAYQTIATDCSDLYDKLRKQVKHNKEYIEDIISGSIEIDAGNTKL